MNMKNHLTRSMLIAGGLLLAAVPATFAAGSDEKFERMDTNGDGQISRTEHSAGGRQVFTQLDTNGDGAVTVAEMEAKQDEKLSNRLKFWEDDTKTATERIAAIDSNGDSQLTASEHEAGYERMFDRMDTNGDGSLSREECEAGYKAMKDKK